MRLLADKLYWQTEKADGGTRSLLAMFLDPVGACIQPSDLSPFTAEDAVPAAEGEPVVAEQVESTATEEVSAANANGDAVANANGDADAKSL